jgi:hypothetical protein
MLRLRDLRFLFILVTCCSALLMACTRRTSVPGPIDKVVAAATPWGYKFDSAVPPDPAVATATPSLPDEVGGLELVGYLGSGPIRAFSIQGDLAYIGLGRMLEIVRLTDPARQERVGYIVLPGDVLDVVVTEAVSGRAYAYVAVWLGGLYVVDVTDPAQPLVVGTHYVSTHVTAVAVRGVHLYVSAGALRVMDLEDPASPTEVGAYQPADPMGNADKVVAVSDRYAYVIYGGGSSKAGSLRIVDVSEPTMPFEVGSYRAGVLVHDGAIVGRYAYLIVGLGRPYLVIVDISDPSQPVAVGPVDTKAWLGERLAATGSTLYLTSPGPPDVLGYVQILDASDPAYPVAVGRYEGVPLPVGEIAIRDEQAFLAAGDKLVAVDVSTPSAPAVWGIYDPRGLPGMVMGAAVAGDYVYIAAGRYGLLTVDASDPANPRLTGGLDTAGHAWDVALWAGYAYVADEFSGLRVIDVHDPARPVEVGHDDVPGRSKFFADVAIRGRTLADRSSGRIYAYVADAHPENTGLRIIDVSDLAAPKQVGHLRLAEGEQGDIRAYGLAVDGDYAYVAVGGAGLRVVDVSDPSSPVEVGVLDVPGRANNLIVADDRAYLVDGDLRIVDISDPASPREIGFYDVPNLSAWPYVAVEGHYAYLTAQGTGVLDVSDLGAPVEVASYPLAQGYVVVANGLVYVTGDGLSILRPRALAEAAASSSATPKPECETNTASLSLSVTHAHLYPGDFLTVTARLCNEGCGTLGLTRYSLQVESAGEQSLFPVTPKSVIHHVGIAPGQSDTIEFVLSAGRPGRSVLTALAGFEFHSGYPGPASWVSESSGPLNVTVMPPELELVPEGDLMCFVSSEVPVKVCLPRGSSVSRSVEQNRRGSLVSYRLTPPEGSETPYLTELQFFTEASIEGFAKYCEEHSPCFFGDYPDLARYYGQKRALEQSETLDGYELRRLNDRAFLVSNQPCYGENCVIREYTALVRDIKVDLWVVLGDESQVELSDQLVDSLAISQVEVEQ